MKPIIFILTCLTILSITTGCTQETYPHTVETPDNYEQDEASYPLLIFLHGAGERGDDLSKLGKHGPLKLMNAGKTFEQIVYAPLCPEDQWWEVDRLQASLEKLLKEYRIDRDRIYLTGLSMGGYATWKWAAAYPDQFAAIAPICGGGDHNDVEGLAKIPIWAFHGDADELVPLLESHKMIVAIQDAGGRPHFTIYEGVGHDSWTETYANDQFWEWLFSH